MSARSQSLHDIEKLLEEELYATNPELRKPSRTYSTPPIQDEEFEDIDVIVPEELPPIGKISLFDRLVAPPKNILSKYRSDQTLRRAKFQRHCCLCAVILLLVIFLSLLIGGAKYFYDPQAQYPPLEPIPDIRYPEKMQKWTFRFPQPTNRHLFSVSGDHSHGYYIGGSQGAFLYSTSVESSDPSHAQVPSNSSHCHSTELHENGNEIWSWIPTPFLGTVETIRSVNNSIYVQIRESDLSTRAFSISKDLIHMSSSSSSSSSIDWVESSMAFDGNVVFGNGIWLGLDRNSLYSSVDGVIWDPVEIVFSENFLFSEIQYLSIAFGNGRFVILAASMSLHYSLINPSDGTKQPWQYYPIETQVNNLRGVSAIQFSEVSAAFIAFIDERIQSSDDGINWHIRYTPSCALETLMCSGYARCVGTCNSEIFMESNSGGLTWSESTVNNVTIHGVYCDAEDFCIIAGNQGSIYASEIISNWWNVGVQHSGGCQDLDVFNSNTRDSLIVSTYQSFSGKRGFSVSSNVMDWEVFVGPNIPYFDFLRVNSENRWVGADRSGTFYYAQAGNVACNWILVQNSPPSTVVQDVKTAKEKFVATGYITDYFQEKHGITFYTGKDATTWHSADSDALINQFVFSTVHSTYMGISTENDDESLNGIYYSLNAIHWVLVHSGTFVSIATDNRTGISLASDGTSIDKSTDGGWVWKSASCGNCAPCSVWKIGFINELGIFYQITNTMPQEIYISYDDSATWQQLVFPFQIPIYSMRYASGSLIALTDDNQFNTKRSSHTVPMYSRGILSIPVANTTTRSCIG